MEPMQARHLDVCVDLFADIFANPPWLYEWLRREGVVAYFTDLWHTPGFRGFVRIIEGRVCAACLGVTTDYFAVKTYEIKEIFVQRGMQNAGIGGAFLAEIEEALAADGVGAVTLYTQRSIPAFDFYSKRGYYAATDAVMMNKPL